jgi:DNA-binding MarR family transcriptional regulator
MDRTQLDIIRSFNRAVTLRSGATDGSYLGRGRPLGQARLLFEIGEDGRDLKDLRDRLRLDSGYLSRLLAALRRQGLVTVRVDPADRRQRRVVLTSAGRAEWAAYDALSDEVARSMAASLPAPDRERLVAAMAEVRRLLGLASLAIAVEPPASRDARACVAAYIRELEVRFEEGFDPGKGNPTPDDAALTPPAGCFIIARMDGVAVGCGALRRLSPGIGEIKRMWVAPEARGLGLSRRLLAALEEQARGLGFDRVRLDTNRALKEAQALYRSAGYRAIERFNDNPYADFWFEKGLAGSTHGALRSD